jgi:hypothetical protein
MNKKIEAALWIIGTALAALLLWQILPYLHFEALNGPAP